MKSLIPRSALEHHIAFVGKTGSGKTGSAKSGNEPALAAAERVCVIDPTGAWWGLRLGADGKSQGHPIYVFGGDHGDFPLVASQGEMMAEAIGETSTSAILDTTQLKTGERMRFFTDFADAILRVNRGPLRLVIDEAHLFAPQAAPAALAPCGYAVAAWLGHCVEVDGIKQGRAGLCPGADHQDPGLVTEIFRTIAPATEDRELHNCRSTSPVAHS